MVSFPLTSAAINAPLGMWSRMNRYAHSFAQPDAGLDFQHFGLTIFEHRDFLGRFYGCSEGSDRMRPDGGQHDVYTPVVCRSLGSRVCVQWTVFA